MTNEIPEGDRDNLCLKRPNLSVKHASAIINLKRATTAKESNENVEKRLCVQRGKRSNLLLSNRIRSPRPPPKMEKANKSSWAPVGRKATWMVLTMRPERRKSRPRGSTTSTSGIAMAGRRCRRSQSRRVGSGGRRRWRSSLRLSFPGGRSASCGGRRRLRRRRRGRGTRGSGFGGFYYRGGRGWMSAGRQATEWSGCVCVCVHGWLGNTRGWCATSDNSF